MLKNVFTTIMLTFALNALAATPNDTIGINQSDVKKWVETEVVNTKGNKVKKYYCIWKEQLVPTSKTVYEKAMLCNKFGAKCALILIGKKTKTGFSPKRIALN